jgi:hypothetical protein
MTFLDQVRSRAMRAWRGVLGHIFPGTTGVFHSSVPNTRGRMHGGGAG